MNIEKFFRQWTSTRPNLKTSFHDAGIEAMAFAEAYHKNELSERQKAKEQPHQRNSDCSISDVSQQRELFVSFARFAHNYGKGSYGTSYEEMFSEWLQKRNK